MAQQKINLELPVIYHKLFPDIFNETVPKETFATCANCAMVCGDDKNKEQLAMRPFLPDKKCCTYHPSLPNYLIGGILSDPDPQMDEGKKRIHERITARTGVSPAGVYAPKIYNIIYSNGSGAGFGNSSTLLCPYFIKENGYCSVWKYRESVCSTFFCKTVAAQNGKMFWDSVKGYLVYSQTNLTKYCLLKLDLSSLTDVINTILSPTQNNSNLSLEDLDNLPTTEADYQKLWGNWQGKEAEFYIKCFELVNKLSKEEYNSIVGIQNEILVKDLESKKNKMTTIPEKLKKNEELVFKKAGEDSYTIKLASIDTSFELPNVVIDIFDGSKATKAIIEELNTKEDIELDNELLLTLFQHRILVEAK